MPVSSVTSTANRTSPDRAEVCSAPPGPRGSRAQVRCGARPACPRAAPGRAGTGRSTGAARPGPARLVVATEPRRPSTNASSTVGRAAGTGRDVERAGDSTARSRRTRRRRVHTAPRGCAQGPRGLRRRSRTSRAASPVAAGSRRATIASAASRSLLAPFAAAVTLLSGVRLAPPSARYCRNASSSRRGRRDRLHGLRLRGRPSLHREREGACAGTRTPARTPPGAPAPVRPRPARPEQGSHDQARGAAVGDVLHPHQPHRPASRNEQVEQDDHRHREGGLAREERDRLRRVGREQHDEGQRGPQDCGPRSRAPPPAGRRRRSRGRCRPAPGAPWRPSTARWSAARTSHRARPRSRAGHRRRQPRARPARDLPRHAGCSAARWSADLRARPRSAPPP